MSFFGRLFDERLRHRGDDVRLRDRLAEADRQRRVLVGAARERFVDEQVPRHGAHALEHGRVPDAFGFEPLDEPLPRAGRRHADAVARHAVHRNRSNHVATFAIAACAVRSTLIGDTETNPSAIAWKSVPGPVSWPCARGADPIDRTVVRIERLHGGLRLVAEAEARRTYALQLLERHVGHVDVQDHVRRQRIRDVALDELAHELRGRRVVLGAG